MSRIGRAVLYASFALSLSVTGVMAASEQAIPGDPFYPLKRQIEDMRMHVLPPHLHDELAASELRARIVELDRLAAAGDTDALALQAGAVADAYEQLLSLGGSDDLTDRLLVAAALLDGLPDQARSALEFVLPDLPGVGPGDHAGTPGVGRDRGDEPPGWSQGGGPAEPGSSDTPPPAPKPMPTNPPRAAEPTRPPQAQPGQPSDTQPPKPSQAAEPSKPPQAQPATTPNPGRDGGPRSSPPPP